MVDKKDDDKGRKDADDQNSGDGNGDDSDDDDNDDSGDGDDEAGWARMQEMIDTSVGKALDSWASKQKTTSSSSRRKPEKKEAPKRKTGFLSTQFFSGLKPEE